MNIKELRVGNFILFAENSTIFEVVEIDEYGVSVKNEYEETWIDSDTFQGIDIDKDWLENLRFDNLTSSYGYPVFKLPSFDGQRQIRYSENSVWIATVGSGWAWQLPNIKYVHQLQNLYFALTGQELMLSV